MKKVLLFITMLLVLSLSACQAPLGKNMLKVASDSMAPEIVMGDIVTYEKVDFDLLQVGDIVVVEADGIFITHRIVEIGSNENGKYLILKGDNNLTPGIEPYYESQYIGKVIKVN